MFIYFLTEVSIKQIKTRHEEMELADYLNVIIWMDVRVCFPFILLAIGLFCMVGNLHLKFI